ncbi:MBL fold metallo-hydrolase [Carnobacterium gallinarum]|uniref:MBL fold metallo-hydrolase n=1 Tax=Carnobacterium gallinarum TaxID=2749 RepID=UPI000552E096|nr:MBL fold metallo-hydrolase [Carnobacterium gallinarum]
MQKIIEKIEYFACGYCVNYKATLFKNTQKEKMIFPAGVFLFKHPKEGYILYDTGYSTQLYQKKLIYRLYCRINPTYITEEETIDQQLKKVGIEVDEIKIVILSHLHPDHIGAVKRFPNARILLSNDAYQSFVKPKLTDIIFSDFLPENFGDRVEIIQPNQLNEGFLYKETMDLFGDGSLLLASFDGHAKGQLCLYFPEYRLFIGADICWGIDLIPLTERIKWLPVRLQNNKKAYFESIALLKRIMADGIQVAVSHDPEERVRDILK